MCHHNKPQHHVVQVAFVRSCWMPAFVQFRVIPRSVAYHILFRRSRRRRRTTKTGFHHVLEVGAIAAGKGRGILLTPLVIGQAEPSQSAN